MSTMNCEVYIHLQIEFVAIRKKWFEIELRIKKRVACLYGVIMHDGGMLGEYERSL